MQALLAMLCLLAACSGSDPVEQPIITPVQVPDDSASIAAWRSREAIDSTLLTQENPHLYKEILRGDSLISIGDTAGAIWIWREIGIQHRWTYLHRETLRRLAPNAILKYMSDHPPGFDD